MNSRSIPGADAPPATEPSAQPVTPAAARFDRRFIEEHRLLERYLDGKLPFKGARDLENWCRRNPEYLTELRLAERTHAGLELLEASGRPQDLREPQPPWWRSPYVTAALAALSLVGLVGCWALFGKYAFMREELRDARARLLQGTLVQPTVEGRVTVSPDHGPSAGLARLIENHATPRLLDLHVDMGYSKHSRFRVLIDKQDQGRALVLEDMQKDSNGELRATVNTSGFAPGLYAVRIEGLPFQAPPMPEGWLWLEIR